MTDVSVTLRPPYLCPSEGHKHGVSIQSSINLGDTLLQITREWKTAKTWFLARLFIYQSSIVSPILDLIHWMVTVFSFHHMTSENQEYDYDFGFLWIARSAILVEPHTQNIAGGKISGFERKAFTRQNFQDSKVFGFKVPTLDSGFKVSGDMTKPGCFHFGFVLLCVNGKTNPVLKRSGFITNPEQFPLV